MIIKTSPDPQKANSLSKMAELTLERLQTTDITKYPSNSLTDYYDIIHKLLEAIGAKQGVKTVGEGAHQELIDHIARSTKLPEQTRLFLQQLRDHRNRISYEGFFINENFITQNQQKIEDIILQLKELANK